MRRSRANQPVLGRRAALAVGSAVGAGRQLTLPTGHSMLVVGPTQVGKTSSLVIPAIARWRGPLVVASVKSDVLELTSPWRRAHGRVEVLRPGQSASSTWDPLETVRSHRIALGVARDLVIGRGTNASAESEFWNTLAVKVLGALIWTAVLRGESIFDLASDVECRRVLEAAPSADVDAARVISSLDAHEPRTLDAVLTTVEAMLAPWSLRQPLARLGDLLDGDNTCYLVAPRHEQRRHEGLLRGALNQVIAQQQAHVDSGTARDLLMVLDEAASVAPLDDLDQLAATGSGLGITLVSVFQDFSQIEARFGERAATIVNNHATRLVLGGLVDHRVATYLPEATSIERHGPLRRWPRGSAVLVSGASAVTTTRLVPWWRSAQLRARLGSR